MSFGAPFGTVPQVIVTVRDAEGTSFPDMFAVTIRAITTNGFRVKLRRIGQATWAQTPQLTWLAWT